VEGAIVNKREEGYDPVGAFQRSLACIEHDYPATWGACLPTTQIHLATSCVSPDLSPSFIRTIPSVLDLHQFMPKRLVDFAYASPPIGNWPRPHPAPKEDEIVAFIICQPHSEINIPTYNRGLVAVYQ
jgi:hypothetical protein